MGGAIFFALFFCDFYITTVSKWLKILTLGSQLITSSSKANPNSTASLLYRLHTGCTAIVTDWLKCVTLDSQKIGKTCYSVTYSYVLPALHGWLHVTYFGCQLLTWLFPWFVISQWNVIACNRLRFPPGKCVFLFCFIIVCLFVCFFCRMFPAGSITLLALNVHQHDPVLLSLPEDLQGKDVEEYLLMPSGGDLTSTWVEQ